MVMQSMHQINENDELPTLPGSRMIASGARAAGPVPTENRRP
jgi:hypothetical protein